MAQVYISPEGVLDVNSRLASGVAMTEAASTAAQAAMTAVAPLASFALGLTGIVGACRQTIGEVRDGTDRLVRVTNACVEAYQRCEQGVYELWGGSGDLYAPAPTGGVWGTTSWNVGKAVQGTIDGIKSWWNENGDKVVKGAWLVVDTLFTVASVASAVALFGTCPILGIAMGTLAVTYGVNTFFSDLTNFQNALNGKDTDVNYMKSFLHDNLGATGDFLYTAGDLAPIVLGGAGAARTASKITAVSKYSSAVSYDDAVKAAQGSFGTAKQALKDFRHTIKLKEPKFIADTTKIAREWLFHSAGPVREELLYDLGKRVTKKEITSNAKSWSKSGKLHPLLGYDLP